MADWYPTAIRRSGNSSGNYISGYQWRGILHTTEGSTAAGAITAYTKNNSWPHFTVDKNGTVYQHLPLTKSGRTLQNLSGGVETNRARCVQIEVVGFASQPLWPPAQVEALKLLMVWIEQQTGIKPLSVQFGGSNQYGLKNPLEFTNAQWIVFNGWCGHQHVPENSHWDPGNINQTMNYLLYRGQDPVAEIHVTHPPTLVLLRPQNDGYWIVTYDGGVFAFGAAPANMTQIGGDPVERIIAGQVTPSGNGLLLMGEDGGMFALGDAIYFGRVYFP